jgi:hypothetical protein
VHPPFQSSYIPLSVRNRWWLGVCDSVVAAYQNSSFAFCKVLLRFLWALAKIRLSKLCLLQFAAAWREVSERVFPFFSAKSLFCS